MKKEFEECEGPDCKERPEFEETEERIKPLKLSMKQLKIKQKRADRKYRRNSKVVKTKNKIDSRLRRELLKNYGFAVENN